MIVRVLVYMIFIYYLIRIICNLLGARYVLLVPLIRLLTSVPSRGSSRGLPADVQAPPRRVDVSIQTDTTSSVEADRGNVSSTSDTSRSSTNPYLY